MPSPVALPTPKRRRISARSGTAVAGALRPGAMLGEIEGEAARISQTDSISA